MRIRVIVPVTSKAPLRGAADIYTAAARADCEIGIVGLDMGPASIECDYEDALAVPDLLAKVRAAAHQGVDAVVIDCMADPGLAAARELTSIPVVGVAQASMHLAAILAHRFSVVTILERDMPLVERLAGTYGLRDRLASTRPVGIPVLEFNRDPEKLLGALVEQSARAVLDDGAHAIVLGCTGMKGMAGQVRDGLVRCGCDVPVIDPSLAGLKWAEGLAELGLSHSKRSYPDPPGKEIVGYDAPEAPAPPGSMGTSRSRVKLEIVIPVVGEALAPRVRDAYGRFARPGTEVSAVALEKGPLSIETGYSEAMAVPGILSRVHAAQDQGFDAVLVDCMGDPGLEPARELASIPVVGPAQVSMHLAALLGHRFSLITTLSQTIPSVQSLIHRYGLADRAASVRAVEIPALHIGHDTGGLMEALLDQATQAVVKDGGHIVIPACTEMMGLASGLQAGLAERGCEVPVIEAPAAAVKLAEALVDLGLAHSKLSYPTPPDGEVVGYP
jgi:allantoin racemase